jgi:HAD superfamily 5'-nucleotidase-like hydrolase
MNKNTTIERFSRGGAHSPDSRVYINRNLKMDSISYLGFDMDHTLAVYAEEAQFLAFDLTVKNLIEKYSYPKEIEHLRYDSDAVIRGLVVDKRRGNIIKLDHHKYVELAYHGSRKLSREERKRIYSRPGESYRPNTGDYYYLDTLFCLPEACLYMQMIDFFAQRKSKSSRRVDYKKLYTDIREAIDLIHKDGSLKAEITANISKYIVKDPELPKVMLHFLQAGKKLFLLTNSEYYYTDVVMSYLLDGELAGYDSWHDYFQMIVVSAGKPGFFLGESPLKIPKEGDDIPGGVLPKNGFKDKVYCGGCFRLMEKELNAKGEAILYFGDHTFGDVLKSKQTCGWRTVMVVRELEDELAVLTTQREDKQALEDMRKELHDALDEINMLENKISFLRNRKMEYYEDMDAEQMKDLDAKIARFQQALIEDETRTSQLLQELKKLEEKLNSGYNSKWGSLFKSSRRKSRFGDQIEDFACLYTSKVTNFLNYPATKYFRIKTDLMAHERDD